VAEREGVEPSEHLVGIHAISSRAPSATRASLRKHNCGIITSSGIAVKENQL
jgi:hypothetical protein